MERLEHKKKLIDVIVLIFVLIGIIFFTIEAGSGGLRREITLLTSIVDIAILFILLFEQIAGIKIYSNLSRYVKDNAFSITVFLVYAFASYFTGVIYDIFVKKLGLPMEYAGSMILFKEFLLILKLFSRLDAIKWWMEELKLNPAQIIALGFASVIIIGSILLMLPASHADSSKPLSYVDSLFTSTSAVCVTGLIVVDTGTFFSDFGKVVILILIQIGGLGIMFFSAALALFSGGMLSTRERFITMQAFEQSDIRTLYKLIRSIFLITIMMEGLGAFLLFLKFRLIMPYGKAAFYSVFHSVSAFCNAGFAFWSDSLMGFSSDIYINIIFMMLIVGGGLGFVVIMNLAESIKARVFHRGKKRLVLQTKIVILVSVILILAGTVFIYILERQNVLAGVNTTDAVMYSMFQSITTRTAGFNTIDISKLGELTLFVMIILMFVGASPGSTGGGIKTTTIYVIYRVALSAVFERKGVEAFKRIIPEEIIKRSIAIFSLTIALISVFTIAIAYDGGFSVIPALFEVVSAMSTVGLSTGITNKLTDFGKIIIIIAMYLGRIGIISAIYLFSFRKKTDIVGYPREKFMVG